MSDDDTINPRRDFLRKSLVMIPVVSVLGGTSVGISSALAAEEKNPVPPPPRYTAEHYDPTYFTTEEWAFLNAAVARLIPADDRGPGALEAGVPEFIDKQMGTTYATGGLWYMQGPFHPDAPKQLGYQLKLSPREIYRLGIQEANAWSKKQHGKLFAELDTATQDASLTEFEKDTAKFSALPAHTFFSLLLTNTKEGFFSDPIHGGNKGMVGWKLIGFPGARADFMDWVERDERYPFPPVSIRGERA